VSGQGCPRKAEAAGRRIEADPVLLHSECLVLSTVEFAASGDSKKAEPVILHWKYTIARTWANGDNSCPRL